MGRILYFFLALIFVAACSQLSTAQSVTDDSEDIQSFNDLTIIKPLNKKIDFALQFTGRIGSNLSKFNEARVGSGIVYKPTDSFSIMPSYQYIEARNSSGKFKTEHRVSIRGTYKFPFERIGLSHRSTYEYRFRKSGNSWRYRPSLTIEKELPSSFISNSKLFVTEEVFYTSTSGNFSRNRFSVGISKSINRGLTLDVYYMRQNDGNSIPGDLNVIGTAWKVKL